MSAGRNGFLDVPCDGSRETLSARPSLGWKTSRSLTLALKHALKELIVKERPSAKIGVQRYFLTRNGAGPPLRCHRSRRHVTRRPSAPTRVSRKAKSFIQARV
jgi:hypothetical protein